MPLKETGSTAKERIMARAKAMQTANDRKQEQQETRQAENPLAGVTGTPLEKMQSLGSLEDQETRQWNQAVSRMNSKQLEQLSGTMGSALQEQKKQLAATKQVFNQLHGQNATEGLRKQLQAQQAKAQKTEERLNQLNTAKEQATFREYEGLSAGDKALGQYGKGNIDLYNRPQYQNPDGSISTVDSASYNIDGKEVLLPTVWMKDGKAYHSHDDDEIVQHYFDTGEYLGKFDTPEEANAYGEQLHRAQDFYYGSQYKTTANGNEAKMHALTGTYAETGFGDVYYDYINGNQTARDVVLANDTKTGTTHAGWKDLPEDVVKTFNYLYAQDTANGDTEHKTAYEYLGKAASKGYTGSEAMTYGLLQGTGLASVSAALGSALGGEEGKKNSSEWYGQFLKDAAGAKEEHGGMYQAGSIGGNLLLMSGIGSAAGAGAKALGMSAGALSTQMATGAMSFAGANALQNAGAAATGYISGKDYLKGIAVSGVQGMAGNLAGGLVGSGMANVLRDKGLMTPFMEFVRQTASGMTNATVNQAVGYAAADEKPSNEDIASGLVTAFAFSVLTSAIGTYKTTQAQKTSMESAYKAVERGYAELLQGTENMTPEAKAQRAQVILEQTQNLRESVNSRYIAGQQKAVNELNGALDIIEQAMQNYISGYNATAAATQTPGNMLPGAGSTGMLPTADDTPQAPTDPTLTQQVEQELQTAIRQGLTQEQAQTKTASGAETAEPKSLTKLIKENIPAVESMPSVAEVNGNIIYTNRETPDSAPDARASQTGAYDSVAENEVSTPVIPRETAAVNGVMLPTAEGNGTAVLPTAAGTGAAPAHSGASSVAERLEAMGVSGERAQSMADGIEAFYRGEITDGETLKELFSSPEVQNVMQQMTDADIEAIISGKTQQPASVDSINASGYDGPNTEGRMNYGTEQQGYNAANGGGEIQLPDGNGGRVSGESAGGQNGILAEGGSQRAADSRRAAIERQNTGRDLRLEKISSRELGLENGTDARTLSILPREEWDAELQQAGERSERETGRPVTMVLGSIRITDSTGKTRSVRGIYSDSGIIVQADNLKATPGQIVDHEIFHNYADENPGLIQAIERAIVKNYDREEFNGIVQKYMQELRGIVDVPENGMSDEFEDALLDVENEIFADAYAGINAFGAHAEKYQDTVRQTLEERGVVKPDRENAAATDRRTGPPERYSIAELSDGKKYVRADRQVIFGNDPDSWSEQLEDYINGKIRRGEDVTLIGADGDELRLTATSAGKLSDNHTGDGRTMSDEAFERKANAASHIDELAQVSEKKGRVKRDHENRHGDMASGGWAYRTAFFEDFDGKYYEVTISVAQGENGNQIYNIGQIKEEAHPKIKGSRTISDDGPRGFASSGNSISETGGNVNGEGKETDAAITVNPSPGVGRSTASVSADSVAENGLPVKARFSMDEPVEQNTKISKETDEMYMAAVREGDTWAAQRLVSKAAKAAGYTTQMLYHGTGRFGYTSFDMNAQTASSGLIYATDKANVAANYGGSRDVYAPMRNINKRLMEGDSTEAVIHNAESVFELKTHVVTEAERKAAIGNVVREFEEIEEVLNSLDYDELPKIRGWNAEEFSDSIANAYDLTMDIVWSTLGEYETNEDGTWESAGYDYLKTAAERFEVYYPKLREAVMDSGDTIKGTTIESLYNLLAKHTLYDAAVDAQCTLLPLIKEGATVLTDGKQFREKEALAEAIDRVKSIGTYKLYGDPGDNVLEIDAGGRDWLSLKAPEMDGEYHSTDTIAKWAKGNGYTSAYVKDVHDGGDNANEYIFFDQEQVKSADPVTYDDNGDVIPLSERFNHKKRDIRYSASEDDEATLPTAEEKEKPEKKKKEKKPRKTTKPVAESLPIIAKKDFRQNMLNLFSIPAGMRAELGSYADRLADKLLASGELNQKDRDEFFNRMYESGVVTIEADEYFQNARKSVIGQHIYVPEGVKHEFADDWGNFRRQAFAAGVILTNNRTDNGIDAFNAELAERLPGLFRADELDERAILERIVQMAEEGKSENVSLAEYTAMLAGEQYVSEDEVLDNIERQMDWALRTFAEKAKLEIKLRDRTGVKIAQEREKSGAQQQKAKEREMVRKAKEKAERLERVQRQRENRELREMQRKTLKAMQWLAKNRQRAPEELKSTWDDVLGDIDTLAIGAANEMNWSRKYEATWGDLAQMYKDARENDRNFLPSKELENIVNRLDKTKIADMDMGALQDLYKAAVGLRTEFYNRNNVIGDETNRLFAEVYADSTRELRFGADTKAGKNAREGRKLDRLFNTDQLSPMNVMQRMAGWNPESSFYGMAKQLEKGERDIRAYTVKANKLLRDFLTEHEDWVKKADGQGDDGIWYEVKIPQLVGALEIGKPPKFGDTITVWMTPTQKVHMYLESKNYDNLRHMEGGRIFPVKSLYSQGKRESAFAQGKLVRLEPETVKALVRDLTPEEQELAGLLENYYNQFAAKEINRVSNILYGYDKAVSKNYAPIYADTNYTKSELGVYDATAEGVGNLKARQHSKNPSYNIGAFDAFERHVEQTARFVGMAIPARNWNTLLGWNEYLDDGRESMRSEISHTWGDESLKYIEGLIETLQGGAANKSDSVSTGAEKVFSNYISAVFGANPSIVLKQLGSIPLAAVWLGMGNFPTPAQVSRIDRDLIAKYTQELDWRTMGYSTPETKQLKDNPNWTQTNKPFAFLFGGGAITAMDGWAASVLWPWAENKVRREHPELEMGTQEQIDSGSSQFYQKVAEEFNEAVARSQSTSDETHQGTLRKSKNPVTRAFTMFKSDSSQTYNALRQKAGEADYHKRKGDTEKQHKANKALAVAIIAAVGGYIWAESVEFLMNLWKRKGKAYRDEDGNLTAESAAREMVTGLVSDLAGVVVGGEEIFNVFDAIATKLDGGTWYDSMSEVTAPGLEQLSDIFKLFIVEGAGTIRTISDIADVVDNGGDFGEYLHRHWNDIAGGIKEVAAAVATYLPGLSVNNLEAYLLGTVSWAAPGLAAAYEDTLATADKSGLKGLTGSALQRRVSDILGNRRIETDGGTAAEIARLYEAGYTKAAPADTPGSISVNGESRELSAYQQQVYDKVWSGTIGDNLKELTAAEEYQEADDETKAKMLYSLYDYAGEKAKAVLFEDYEQDSFAEDADGIVEAGASAADWAAWYGESSALEPESGKTGVSDTQKYALLQEKDYDDKIKQAIAGSIMGTDMETGSGNPSQYAKMLQVTQSGLSMDDYLTLKLDDAVDGYLEAIESGVDSETAFNMAQTLNELEPAEGKSSVSEAQRWRAAIDAADDEEAQKAALKAVMTDNAWAKYEIADSFGVEPEAWVQLKETLPKYDADGNGSYKQTEVEAAIDGMGGSGALLAPWDMETGGTELYLTNDEKAVLWQLYTGSKSAKNNPYSVSVGQRVLDAKEAAKNGTEDTETDSTLPPWMQ